MKRFFACMMLVVGAFLLSSGAVNAASDAVVLRVSHFLPSSHPTHKFIVSWCDKISKESEGKMKCQVYPSLQLGGSPVQVFDQAINGVADVVWTVPTYQAGRFTKTEVFELPFLVKHAETGSPAIWDYIQKDALDEFKGVKLLAAYLVDGNELHFGKKSVKSLEDLKGLKVRASNRLGTKTLAALGAVPVQIPAPSLPEALSKSVVDGACVSWEATTPFKLQEVCKTHTETPPNKAKAGNSVIVFAMNLAKYNSLSPELKKVIDRNSGLELTYEMGKLSHGQTAPARKIAANRHNTINVLTDAEYNRWVKAAERVHEDWFKEVAAKGADGKALLSDAKAMLKKYHD